MSEPTVLYDALGPRGRRRVLVLSVLTGLAVIGLAALAVLRFADKGQLDASRWRPFERDEVQRLLLYGLLATVKVALVAGVLAFAVGLVLALLRLSGARWVRWPTGTVIEFMRGFPLLLLIFFIARLFGRSGIQVSNFTVLVLGLTLYNSAVFAEIIRAGILSLDRGQREAASAIGLTHGQSMRLVILPQALRRMVPTLISQEVTLLKDSSLGFVVNYDELLTRSRRLGEFFPTSLLQALMVAAVLYILVNLTVSRFAVWLERRQSRRYGRAAAGTPSGAPPGPTPVLEGTRDL